MSLLFDQYTERLRRKRKSPNTIRLAAGAAHRFERWLALQGLTPERASLEDIEEYMAQLPLASSSKNTHLRYIKAAYSYAAQRGTIPSNPALDVEEEQLDPREPRVIGNHELREIRDHIRYQREWVFFHLLAYTGMRRSEIVGLRWDDGSETNSVVRLEDQTIRVMGKGRKLRYVPIHPALGEVLVKEREQTRSAFVVRAEGQHGVAVETVQRMVKGFHAVYTPHDYRRTVATSLARNGVEERLIDRIMGWAAASVRDRYYVNVAAEELHRAILKLYADDPL